MAKTVKTLAMNQHDAPVLTIQCDWEDFIEIPNKRVWLSRKCRRESGLHTALFNTNNGIQCDCPDFTAALGRNSLCVKYNVDGNVCRFIPAFQMFSNIHKSSVLSLDVADGGLGVSSCTDGKLLVWDNNTGEVRRTLSGHVGEIYKCKYFPSGIVILSAGMDCRIKIWGAEDGSCPVTLTGHTQSISDLCIIDRGRNIISVSKDGTARLWNCGDKSCLDIVLNAKSPLNTSAIVPIPDSMDISNPVDSREIGTQDKILLVGSEEGIIYSIILVNRKLLYTVNVGSAVNAILHFSKNVFVSATEEGSILVHNVRDGAVVKTIHESNSPVRSLARFQEKGVLVGRQDGTVTYISLQSQTLDRIQLTGPNCDPVYCIVSTADAIFTGCRDGKIRKYKVSDLIAGGA